nr:uncharacterized protein LOC100665748 isoform X2 [Loxodonta africana]
MIQAWTHPQTEPAKLRDREDMCQRLPESTQPNSELDGGETLSPYFFCKVKAILEAQAESSSRGSSASSKSCSRWESQTLMAWLRSSSPGHTGTGNALKGLFTSWRRGPEGSSLEAQ